MTLQQLLTLLADYMRSARVVTDQTGELVIHTGMFVDKNYLVELTQEEI